VPRKPSPAGAGVGAVAGDWTSWCTVVFDDGPVDELPAMSCAAAEVVTPSSEVAAAAVVLAGSAEVVGGGVLLLLVLHGVVVAPSTTQIPASVQ